MSSFSLDQNTYEKIEMAIDNGWTLRPCGPSGFINMDYAKKIKLSDKSHILDDAEDLEKYPTGITCVALIAMHLEDINFVSLDFDFKDKELEKKVWELLKDYDKKNLFQRIGNREKLGQFWFQTENKIRHKSVKQFDVIVHEKRCNMIGKYKDTELDYQWPYKNPWDNLPDELPFISECLIEKILTVVAEHLGEEFKKESPINSRHDYIKQLIFEKMNKPAFLNVIQDVISSPEYISACTERDFKSETGRMFQWAAEQVFENYNDISGFMEAPKSNLFDKYAIDTFPKVEKNSLIDVLYKATKRNQYTDNPSIAFFTALSIASWLLTFSTRYEGLAPNLMILVIAHSGAGKSTSSRAVKELTKLYKEFQSSYMGNDIRTEAALLNNLEEAPNPYYLIDEFTKIMKARNNKSSHTSNISEIMCQLYSDYNDTDLHQVKLKSHSYGVCLGPKMNLLAFSTPEFWKIFSQSDFSQGLGRRFWIFNSDSISFSKKNMDYQKEFFKNKEKEFLKLFIQNNVSPFQIGGVDFLYDTQDIRGYNLVKGLDKKGEVVNWEEAKTIKPEVELTSSDEVAVYFKTEFIDMINDLRKMAMSSANNLNLYVINSMPEFVKKLAMIHTIAGKALFTKNENGHLEVAKRTRVTMDSVEWAVKMFLYYMVNGLSYDLESIYRKDEESDAILEVGREFLEKLEGKEVDEFTVSRDVVKNFFKYQKINRDEVLNNLVVKGKLEVVNKKATKRGKKYRVIKDEL